MAEPTGPENWCPTPANSSSAADALPRGQNSARRGAPELNAMCAHQMSRLMITGMLRDHLARHFGNAELLNDATLRHLIWQDNVETKIQIESSYRWKTENLGKRPALVVRPGPMRRTRLAIKDSAGTSPQGHKRYTRLIIGTSVVFALHGLGPAVEALAGEAVHAVDHFAPELVIPLRLLDLCVTDIGDVAELEEDPEVLGVPITVAWAYRDSWQLEMEAPRLRVLSLRVLTDSP